MKNLSFVLNGVLVIAVAILFYQVYSLKSSVSSNNLHLESKDKTDAPVLITNSGNLKNSKIAYINTDSINEHYGYISDFTKNIRGRKAAIEAQLESMTLKFQQNYEAFQQSAQAGIAPQAELMKQEENLKRQQSDLANKELQLQNLGTELEEKNMELNKNVKEYLKTINNGKFDYIFSYSDLMPVILLANPEFDITSQVLKGLNEEYNASKKKK